MSNRLTELHSFAIRSPFLRQIHYIRHGKRGFARTVLSAACIAFPKNLAFPVGYRIARSLLSFWPEHIARSQRSYSKIRSCNLSRNTFPNWSAALFTALNICRSCSGASLEQPRLFWDSCALGQIDSSFIRTKLADGKPSASHCFFLRPSGGTTRSRCETGVDQACYCTALCNLGQRIMMVPQPKKRPEALLQTVSGLHP